MVRKMASQAVMVSAVVAMARDPSAGSASAAMRRSSAASCRVRPGWPSNQRLAGTEATSSVA